MISLRHLHNLALLLAGMAMVAAICGSLRFTTAGIVLAIVVLVLSLERLRHATQTGSRNP